MLNGYDNPDPTPTVSLTGLEFNQRFPKGPIAQVPAFSERIEAYILKEEEVARKPRDLSQVVIPETGFWRKMGNRTFYDLYGLHYIHHSAGKNGIQEAIDKAKSRVFIKDANYPISTNITPKSGIFLEGETSKGTLLQANANSLKIFSVAATVMNNMRFYHLGLDANGKTGLTGFDMNISSLEASVNNWLFDIFFANTVTGGFTTLWDLTGNEDSFVDLLYIPNATGQGFGESYALVHNGAISINRFIQSSPSGTAAGLHVMGTQVFINNSVLNTIITDNQSPGDFNTTGILTVKDTFLANGQPANVPKIQNGVGTQGTSILNMALSTCYVGLASAGAMFGNSQSRTMTINALGVSGCTFVNLDASGVKWISQPGGLQATVAGTKLNWGFDNRLNGTILEGDIMTGGFGQYYFEVPPAGWGWKAGGGWGTGVNSPALPAGTGSGNAVRNRSNRPCMVYQTGMVGTHIIDSEGNGTGAIDSALGVDPTAIQLNPFEQVYYATTKPSAWTWYGL